MVRFLHTADWQLGAKLAFLKEKAGDARKIRLETVRRVMKLAKDLDVDFVVVAGDLFEDHSVGSSV
ncbi:MAG: metallophosphoesterase, partial [Peptococcaceae bacterium]|nr:metallophosphoesterase [Peptococcaceae bacterium]